MMLSSTHYLAEWRDRTGRSLGVLIDAWLAHVRLVSSMSIGFQRQFAKRKR